MTELKQITNYIISFTNSATIRFCVYNICRGEYHSNSEENVIFSWCDIRQIPSTHVRLLEAHRKILYGNMAKISEILLNDKC